MTMKNQARVSIDVTLYDFSVALFLCSHSLLIRRDLLAYVGEISQEEESLGEAVVSISDIVVTSVNVLSHQGHAETIK